MEDKFPFKKLLEPMTSEGVDALKLLLEQGITRSHRAKVKALRMGDIQGRKEAVAKEEIYTEIYSFVQKVVS